MRKDGFVNAVEHSLPESSAVPEAAQTLLATYPGPVILCRQGQIERTNAAAETLLERSSWWTDVAAWLATRPQGPALVRIPTDASPITVEWTALLLGGEQYAVIGRNISLERNLQEMLTVSRDRFKDLVELTADLAWETDAHGVFTYIAGGRSLGYKPEALLGRRGRDMVVRQPLEVADYFESDTPLDKRQISLRRADGSIARIQISARPLLDAEGERRGARGICRDITESVEKQDQLAQVQRRDRLIAEFMKSLREAQSAKTALEIAAREIMTALNASGCRIYHIDGQNQLQMATEAGIALPEAVNGYNRRLQAEGGRALMQENLPSAMLMGATTVQGAHLNGAIWVWRPVGPGLDDWPPEDRSLLSEVADHLGIVIAQLGFQERLRILSECDGLTQLLNRRTFMEKLGEKLAQPGIGSALFYLDLDNFKAVNDTHGHQRGDMVIRKVAEILHHMTRPCDLSGRIGGDEFVLWVEGIDRPMAETVAKQLVGASMELRSLSASPSKQLGVSVGVAIGPPGVVMRAGQLMDKADAAMYEAKRGGKSTWAMAE